MATPARVVTTTPLAYSPAPCPELDAILADDEHSLPVSNGQPLPDGRVQQGPHGAKRSVYASLGVREYFIYDPPGRRRKARVLGLRLHGGRYVEMPTERLAQGTRGVLSDTVGLVAYVNDNGDLRWFDTDAGRDLENYVESSLRAIAAEAERDELRARLAEAQAALHQSQTER